MKALLTDPEKIRLESLIIEFSRLSEKMDVCEMSLLQLEEEKSRLYTEVKSLSEEIEKVREEETEFTRLLIKKYGEFSLNIKTLDIEINE